MPRCHRPRYHPSVNCIVTAGPTYEPLDQVRRLTNFSTGRLGIELANHLVRHGHHVTLFLGDTATWAGERAAHAVETFSTAASLAARFQVAAPHHIEAVFHAAAVSDFTFGKIWSRAETGELTELNEGKVSTRHGSLLAELTPAPKVIGSLRDWFPHARLAGWKYEADGDSASALAKARRQIVENRTDACVANGPAYGEGFGLVTRDGELRHFAGRELLFAALEAWLES